ncbi:MAG: hypothetical protein ACTSVM_03955 [Candidatus Ranarchaeia archaeon]
MGCVDPPKTQGIAQETTSPPLHMSFSPATVHRAPKQQGCLSKERVTFHQLHAVDPRASQPCRVPYDSFHVSIWLSR